MDNSKSSGHCIDYVSSYDRLLQQQHHTAVQLWVSAAGPNLKVTVQRDSWSRHD